MFRRVLLAAVATALIAVPALTLGSSHAAANGNSEQLELGYTNTTLTATQMCVYGWNQNMQVTGNCVGPTGGVFDMPNWWWHTGTCSGIGCVDIYPVFGDGVGPYVNVTLKQCSGYWLSVVQNVDGGYAVQVCGKAL